LCLILEIEALNTNIGRWETTWFNCHILHFNRFNLVGYDLYHRTQGPNPPGLITKGMLKKIQEDGDSQNPLKPKAIHLLFK